MRQIDIESKLTLSLPLGNHYSLEKFDKEFDNGLIRVAFDS